jgi:integrase
VGRKPTVNLNMPPNMRPRSRHGGKVFFYLRTGGTPRKEIPLGSDFILALRKYADLVQSDLPLCATTFEDLERKYSTSALPKLAASTARMYRSDIKHLLAAFKEAPLGQIKPMHIKLFLEDHEDKPTTANRCKRLFSTMWNHARGWGYTDLPNPCGGIKGYSLDKRTTYITDAVFSAVYKHASAPLRDAMDLAYLTGQRPADALRMSAHDLVDGHLIVTQAKTQQPLRIIIAGALADLLERIRGRKASHKIVTAALLTNTNGKRLTAPVLRNHFESAREAAALAHPSMAEEIRKFHFYDLRAKAADDTSDLRGDQAASDLLGHDSVRTTQRHYLRRGKIVGPTK